LTREQSPGQQILGMLAPHFQHEAAHDFTRPSNRAMSFCRLAACMAIALQLTPKDPQLQDATALGLGFLWHL